VVGNLTESVEKKECKNAPDGMHCYHRTMSNVVIPGKAVMDEVCCFCGETKHIEQELPSSYLYSYDSSSHGPYQPTMTVVY